MRQMATCSICLQECEEATDLPCGHRFHAECLVPWLWKQGSCPNCRFTEREESSQESTSVADIRTIISNLRAQRLSQQRRLATNLRHSKKPDAPRELKKNASAYHKYKERIRETTQTQKHIESVLHEHDQTLKMNLNSLYKTYQNDYKEMLSKHKEVTRHDKVSLMNTRQKLRADKNRVLALRLKLIDFDA
tara:strand:- start:8 stop:580 length:573 start_codon:yes stop_codon:yes gene_type:complete